MIAVSLTSCSAGGHVQMRTPYARDRLRVGVGPGIERGAQVRRHNYYGAMNPIITIFSYRDNCGVHIIAPAYTSAKGWRPLLKL